MLSKKLFTGDAFDEFMEDHRLCTLAGQRLCAAGEKLKAAKAEADAAQAELTRLKAKVHAAVMVAISNAERSP